MILFILAGYNNKDEQLIELQDSGARKQVQLQEEADLRALQEQEQSIRQLEVLIPYLHYKMKYKY